MTSIDAVFVVLEIFGETIKVETQNYPKLEVVNIGLPIIEFNRQDTDAVGKIRCVVNHHPIFEELWMGNEGMLSLAGLEIYPGRRKVYHEGEEIELMAKEFDLLCLLTRQMA